MAHNYNVTNVTSAGGTTSVAGTVDGQSVFVTFPTQVFASTAAFQAFVAPLMLAAAPTVPAGLSGSFVA